MMSILRFGRRQEDRYKVQRSWSGHDLNWDLSKTSIQCYQFTNQFFGNYPWPVSSISIHCLKRMWINSKDNSGCYHKVCNTDLN